MELKPAQFSVDYDYFITVLVSRWFLKIVPCQERQAAHLRRSNYKQIVSH